MKRKNNIGDMGAKEIGLGIIKCKLLKELTLTL